MNNCTRKGIDSSDSFISQNIKENESINYSNLGLKNINGTDCFANSIIKLLLYCEGLKNYFLNENKIKCNLVKIPSSSVDTEITNEIKNLFIIYYKKKSPISESHAKL
ncbi:hypothetical protein DICPUDRAFT_151948 [Dictyostelium purpureum]|uniref:USP domain-containing protein n=1 Tax=Dictyostelium purpureum TaxID=5786 RepID=F0ZK43_DICPU|nr:uncharacterized protein DICPUDRAFT_151948 [Dictyostelium purpureum]EGC35685.1 hypothetical protein DICPUDRAFT_151948 [Dictyostelium purpureum]|eukprot:XP_003287785.1 hypothetical protein DICPUDRAFT_151948 [Dictyostelium purpureum]